ncbi:MAG: hypothetical protein H6604_01780 [Flavobacteriales bacterium]|nr:hypothetical protein [Flavobacteriales bacterium]
MKNIVFILAIISVLFSSYNLKNHISVSENKNQTKDTIQTYQFSKNSRTNLSIQDSFMLVHEIETKLDSIGWKKVKENPKVSLTFLFTDSLYQQKRNKYSGEINGSFGWYYTQGTPVNTEIHDVYFRLTFTDVEKDRMMYYGYYIGKEYEKKQDLMKELVRKGLNTILISTPKKVLYPKPN